MSDISAERLVQRAHDQGLLDARQVELLWSELGTRDATLEQMSSLLLRRELLTNWQLDRLFEGRKLGYFYGRHKILYLVGAGTFARVYRAVHTESDKVFAIKVLRQRYSDDMQKTEQFLREARTVIPLRHPNIVPIYEVTSERARYYMAMEFVEGENLRDWLRRAVKLSPFDAVRITQDIVAGLDHAYSKGVSHRDLKNSNVLLSTRGRAMLVDFGLATVDGEVTEKNVGEVGSARSIDYAGLERASGVRNGDKRSDIFFAGCSLYHMLTGKPPLMETKERIQRLNAGRYKGIQPITELDGTLPSRLMMAVNKALEIDASERFQTPAEFLAELQQIKATLDSKATPAPAGAAATNGAAPASEEVVRLEGESRTVMIVESAIPIQDALRERLKKLGYRVLVISNPERALSRFDYNEPAADCVVFGTAELGAVALNAFNVFATDESTKNLPAILLVDQRQKAQVMQEAKLDSNHVVVTLPLKFRQFRAQLKELLAATSASS